MNKSASPTAVRAGFLKPFWAELVGPPWVVSLLIFVVLIAIRFFAYLGPFELPALFFLQTVAMWTIPFVVLDQEGRSEIGLSGQRPSVVSMLLGMLTGAACAVLFLGLGFLIYGSSADNWSMSIRTYLHFDEMRGIMPPLGLFALYSLPAVFLNPIGEEILFRGLIQQAFTRRFHAVVATAVSSLLFGLTYLYLHGIWQDSAGFHFRSGSAVVALLFMALIGAVFMLCRKMSGSLWPAVAAHAAFNLTILALEIRMFVH